MAIYNEILAGRYARTIQKLFSMKGPVPMKQLAGELMIVLPMFYGTEMRSLEGWDRFGVIADQPGAVGNNTGFRIRNPKGSNIIAVIEKIRIQNINAAANLFSLAINTTTAELGAIPTVTNRRFDARGRQRPTCIISTDSNYGPVLTTTVYAASMPANGDVEVIVTDFQELPLLPGDSWDLRSVNTNSEIQVTCWWRERILEESELTAG